MLYRQRGSVTGFTLIELLVVIAIIAILAAILFPVFSRARENSRKSACQSNMKQIAMAVLQYVQDYDETVPPHAHRMIDGQTLEDLLAGRPQGPWCVYIQPYVKSWNVFICGSDKERSWNVETSAPANVSVKDPPNSYGWNYNFVQGGPYRMAVIEEPASIVMLCEQSGRLPYGRWWNSAARMGSGSHYIWRYDRHSDGANYAFWDGHVKWMPGNLVPKSGTAAVWPTQNFRFQPVWP
ncbi:MAG TPA: DUF1559 domain-containing protein [Armatimonadota bacterium]|nr:DUF1559 domain-containing protein [Armatimonadota bacterium]HOM80532.1 DUF1559 domain-containing protein [Armatimonadota bacterium]HPO71423.1 DUF1559 domain-containing protein [Armatimonadota bacterium]HPT96897.1 DUF1559 domain-containing protein [Armatimonadota bacterium]